MKTNYNIKKIILLLLMMPLAIVIVQGDPLTNGEFESLVKNIYHAPAKSKIDIKYTVQLVPQAYEMSCWAAGAAMIVGWRDSISIDPSQIAKGVGYWKQYQKNQVQGGGLHPADTKMFKYWGLTPAAPMTYTVDGFADMLKSKGPLWVAASTPGPHIRVVAAMKGDGTPDGTMLTIYDPWEKGMKKFKKSNKGAIYKESYTEFVKKQSKLVAKESNISGAIYIVYP